MTLPLGQYKLGGKGGEQGLGVNGSSFGYGSASALLCELTLHTGSVVCPYPIQ